MLNKEHFEKLAGFLRDCKICGKTALVISIVKEYAVRSSNTCGLGDVLYETILL